MNRTQQQQFAGKSENPLMIVDEHKTFSSLYNEAGLTKKQNKLLAKGLHIIKR